MKATSTFVATAGVIAALLLAAPAPGAVVTYVDGHNVWIASPDGAGKRQITTSGTADVPWKTPSTDDAGRVLAARDQTHYFMDQFGAILPDGAQVAPKDSCPGLAVGPLTSRINPAGTVVAFWYSCGSGAPSFTITPKVALAYPQTYTAPGNQIEWDDWRAPGWFGDRLFVSDGRAIFIQPKSSDPPPPASPQFRGWIAADGVSFSRASVTRAGDRVLLTSSIDGQPEETDDLLILARLPGGVPDSPDDTPAPLSDDCRVPTGLDPIFGDISPDGTLIAWSDAEGVKVAPTPTYNGTADCAPAGATVVLSPTGSAPALGPAALAPPASPPPGGGGPVTPGTPGAPGSAAAPTFTITFGRLPRLRSALRSGLRFPLSCEAACSITGKLTITRALARKLGLKRATTVATGRLSLAAAGSGRLTLRFSRKARAPLARQRRIALTLSAQGRVGPATTTTMTRRLTLRR